MSIEAPSTANLLPYNSWIAHKTFKVKLYTWIETHPRASKALCIPLAITSAASHAVFGLARTIESLAMVIINLVGATFKAKNCSFKNSLHSLSIFGFSTSSLALEYVRFFMGTGLVLGATLGPTKKFARWRKEFHQTDLTLLQKMKEYRVGLADALRSEDKSLDEFRNSLKDVRPQSLFSSFLLKNPQKT